MIPHACVANNFPRGKLYYAKITKKKKKERKKKEKKDIQQHWHWNMSPVALWNTCKLEPHDFKITPKSNDPHRFSHDSPT